MTTRTRQRLNTFNSEGLAYHSYRTESGLTTWELEGFIFYDDLGETTTDELTPNYWALKKAGAHLPVNSFSNLKSSIILDTPVMWYKNQGFRDSNPQFNETAEVYNHQALGYFDSRMKNLRNSPINIADFPNPPNASRLLQAALANAKTSNFDVGTFLAEANKTFRLLTTVRDTFWRRALAIEADLKKNRRRHEFLNSKAWDVFSQVWLEGRYGWRQLYFDIKNAKEALENMSKIAEGVLVRFTTYDESTDSSIYGEEIARGTYIPNSGWSNPANLLWQYKVTSNRTVGVRAGVGVQPQTAGSFGFIDPFVTGWEVIPFSFIVDWFFNVGQAIAAWSPTGRVDLKHGFVTNIYTEDLVVVGNPITPEDTSWGHQTCDSPEHRMTLRREYKNRVPASPTFNLSFDLNLDVWKIVDLLSIARPYARRLYRRINQQG